MKKINNENNVKRNLIEDFEKKKIKIKNKKKKKKMKYLQNYSEISNDFKIEEFEKDEDSNWHIEFLFPVSNLIAKNFRIKKRYL